MRQTTVIIDMSVATYALLPTMTEYWVRLSVQTDDKMRRSLWDKVLKAQVASLVSCSWLKGYIDVHQPNVCLVYDEKTPSWEYWRHGWLRALTPLLPARQLKRRQRVYDDPNDKIGRLVSVLPANEIAYKDGRKLPDNEMKRLKHGLKSMARQFPVHQLGKEGYEADDMMALMVKLNSELPECEQHDIVLGTNDSDILGLVSDRVTWFDLPRLYRPFVRGSVEDINKWLTEVKKEAPIDHPSEIWQRKAVYGDVSDKLPATGEAMVTLPAIDLLNPPTQYRLWEQEEMREKGLTVLNNPANIVSMQDKAKAVLDKAHVTPVFINRTHQTIPLRSHVSN